jgi:hypothetical protein
MIGNLTAKAEQSYNPDEGDSRSAGGRLYSDLTVKPASQKKQRKQKNENLSRKIND